MSGILVLPGLNLAGDFSPGGKERKGNWCFTALQHAIVLCGAFL